MVHLVQITVNVVYIAHMAKSPDCTKFGSIVERALYIFGSKKKNIRQDKRKTYRHLIECLHQQVDSSIYKNIHHSQKY